MTVAGLCRYGEWRHVATGCTTLVLMKVIGWQWYQLDHMPIICTSLQTDNRIRTSSLNFYRRMLSWRPTNSVKALKATSNIIQTHSLITQSY